MRVWVLQTGEPLPMFNEDVRPMRARNTVRALVARGHVVTLWSTDWDHTQKLHRVGRSATIRDSGGAVLELIHSRGYRRNVGFERLLDHAQLGLNVRRSLGDRRPPDVAMVGFPPIEPAFAMVSWLADRRVPTLLDVKDRWPEYFEEALPPPAAVLARPAFAPYRAMARQTMRKATGISSMADSFLEWALLRAGRRRGSYDGVFPLTSSPPALTLAQTIESEQWWRAKGISLRTRPLRVVFAGTFNSAFDFSPVARAALDHPDVEFVLCGSGSDERQVRTLMAPTRNVVFPGWVGSDLLSVLNQNADLALAPYRNIPNFIQNIPNKVVDAMSYGLPLACPLRGEVEELIERYGIGYHYNVDYEPLLTDVIADIKQSPDGLARRSANCLGTYLARFEREAVYDALTEHLERMSEAHSP